MNNLTKLKTELNNNNIDSALITGTENVAWLSGAALAESYVLITPSATFFITDDRYVTEAKNALGGEFNVSSVAHDAQAGFIGANAVGKIGLTKEYISLKDAEKIGFSGAENIDEIVLSLRRIKTPEEIEKIGVAAKLTQKVFYELLPKIKIGMSEKQVESELLQLIYKHCAKPAFTPIVVTGVNSSLPHGTPTDNKIAAGDFLTIDFGCAVCGYLSDFTRTIAISRLDNAQIMVYNAVRDAKTAAENVLKAGIACSAVNETAYNLIIERGYKEQICHGLGHGVGAEVHEEPRVNATSKDTLSVGDVITIEPGIYFPNKYGVRIEDMYYVDNDGAAVNYYDCGDELIII